MAALRQGPRAQACVRLDAEVGARLRAPATDVSCPGRQGAAAQEHLVGAWQPLPARLRYGRLLRPWEGWSPVTMDAPAHTDLVMSSLGWEPWVMTLR